MARKKATRKRATKAAKTATAPTPTANAARKSTPRPEYLVLRISDQTKIGSSLALLAVEPTMDKAMAAVRNLSGAMPAKVAIVQKTAVIQRQPQISVSVIDTNIAQG